MKKLGVFLLGALFVLVLPDISNVKRVRLQAFYRAKTCLREFGGTQVWDIKTRIEPGDYLTVFTGKGIMEPVGIYYPETNTVVVAEAYKNNVKVWEHEYIHALGVLGHPDEPFKRCRLQAYQIAADSLNDN